MSRQVATASSSQVAAEAAERVAWLGGNAVDAAVAAAMVSVNTEPGVCALAGGTYITVWGPDTDAQCIDGYARVPGLGNTNATPARSETVEMAYGGGVTTVVGAGSIAVPGTPAALALVHERYGRLPWRECVLPAAELCASGFPLPPACHHYLQYSGTSVFGRSDAGFRALHPDGVKLAAPGTPIVVPGLADSLHVIADEGVDAFYNGSLGIAIVDHVIAGGGHMTRRDLADYQPRCYRAQSATLGKWSLALPPPPSIGGCMLGAMLQLIAEGVDDFESMRRCLAYRRQRIDFADDLNAATEALLEAAQTELSARYTSANTVHTSATDTDGLGCAITASAGYGAGEIPAGTGLWMNNCLGEIELNRRGLAAAPAGSTLPTNMAPTVARAGSEVIAIGSPGADRITSAMVQTLVGALRDGKPLDAAIAAPRWHVEMSLEPTDNNYGAVIHIEPGVEFEDTGSIELRRHEQIGMYFGGVGAAHACHRTGTIEAYADPRRVGGTSIAPSPKALKRN